MIKGQKREEKVQLSSGKKFALINQAKQALPLHRQNVVAELARLCSGKEIEIVAPSEL